MKVSLIKLKIFRKRRRLVYWDYSPVLVSQEHPLPEEHHPLEPHHRLHPEERHLVHRADDHEPRGAREQRGASLLIHIQPLNFTFSFYFFLFLSTNIFPGLFSL